MLEQERLQVEPVQRLRSLLRIALLEVRQRRLWVAGLQLLQQLPRPEVPRVLQEQLEVEEVHALRPLEQDQLAKLRQERIQVVRAEPPLREPLTVFRERHRVVSRQDPPRERRPARRAPARTVVTRVVVVLLPDGRPVLPRPVRGVRGAVVGERVDVGPRSCPVSTANPPSHTDLRWGSVDPGRTGQCYWDYVYLSVPGLRVRSPGDRRSTTGEERRMGRTSEGFPGRVVGTLPPRVPSPPSGVCRTVTAVEEM